MRVDTDKTEIHFYPPSLGWIFTKVITLPRPCVESIAIRELEMGNSHLSTLLYIAIIPGALTGVAIRLIGDHFELTSVQLILIAIPLWLLVLSGWVFGMAAIAMFFNSVYQRFYPLPCCNDCDMPLATRLSQQCLHCGADWHRVD